ncbi:MAG: hypothetical protein IT494_04065 [Gammaproteobacteria bacterium]|nr:hypothetical protein [Gammaproteobacteria bacterium]
MTANQLPGAGGAYPAILHVPVAPSRILAQVLAAAAAFSLILLACAPIQEAARWAGIAFVMLWGIRSLHTHERTDLCDLVLDQHGNWQVGSIPHALQPARLLPPSVVLPWLVILRFAVAGQVRALVLTPDNTPPEALRRLRVVLRLPR